MGALIRRLPVSGAENAAPNGAAFTSADPVAHHGGAVNRPVVRSVSQERT